MKQRITYYIGLHSPNGKNDSLAIQARVVAACDSLADRYDAYTLTKSIGVWQGRQEPTLVAVVIVDNTNGERREARRCAKEICLTLEQDAVALTIEPVQFEIITKD